MSKYTDVRDIEKYVLKKSAPIEDIVEEFNNADFLLYSMLDYITQVSILPERILLNVISLIAAGGYKGKVTHLTDDEFILKSCNMLKKGLSMKRIKKLKLTREVIEDLILSFIKETEKYLPIYDKSVDLMNTMLETGEKNEEYKKLTEKLLHIEESVGSSRSSLPGAIKNVDSLYEKYKDIKDRVIVAYLRKSLKKVVENTYGCMESADLFQNTVFGINKAFSLYRVNRGAFSSYLDYWIRFTINEPPFHVEVGTVFYIPPGVKKRLRKEDTGIVKQSYGLELIDTMPLQDENANDSSPLDDLVKAVHLEDMPFFLRRVLGLKYSSLALLFEKPKRNDVIQGLLNQITIREGGNNG